MFQDFLSRSNLLHWPIIGLLVFFVAFLAVVGYAVFGMKKKKIDHVASLPLDDDPPRRSGATGQSGETGREKEAAPDRTDGEGKPGR